MASKSSNNDDLYNVVLTGQFIAGFDQGRAIKSLAQLLNASVAQAQGLLKGSSKVIKKKVNRDQALKYKLLLASHGLVAQVTRISDAVAAPLKAPGSHPPLKATRVSGTEAADKQPKKASKANPKANNPKVKPKVAAVVSTAANVTYISEAVKRKSGRKTEGEGESQSRKSSTVKRTSQAAKPASPATASMSRQETKNQESNIFNGVLQYKAATMLQQLALVAACSVLMVLMVFYAGLFLSAAFFAVERLFSFLFFNTASSIVTAIFIYLIPCIFALLFCVLMLRPVFAKKMKAERLEFSAQNERNLLNFVKQIAAMIGSPKPEEVLITDEFDVVAEFKPTINDIKEARIQLRIGLPLLMVMDIPVLAGAVSAALSRFDDKTGMYMLFLIRELNQRLENAATNRDNWQDVLDSFSKSKHALVSRFLSRVYEPLLTLSAWLAFPFLVIVRAVSAAANRSQCFRSDVYFASLAGTREFVGHFKQLYKCRYAYAEAEESLRAGVEAQKFVNDLPALLLHAYKNLSTKVMAEVDDAIVEQSTRWNDLKPCNRDRMIAAEEEDHKGIVALKAEAWRLLQDLKGSSRTYTLAYYEMHDYGVDEKVLVDAREVATTTNEERMRDEICRQYYNGWFEPELFWQTNQFAYARSISKQQRIVEINECIKILRRSSPDFLALKNEVPDKFAKYSFSRFAIEIHKAGYRLDGDIPGMESVAVGDLSAVNNTLRKAYESRRAQQRDLCRVMGERLCFALAFLTDERERKIAEVVLSILTVLESQANQLEALHSAVFLVPHYRARIKNKDEKEHSRRLRRLSREIVTAHDLAMAEFKRFRWPFGKQYANLADYISRSLPKTNTKDAAESGADAKSTVATLDSRLELYNALWRAITQTNRFLNGKIAPLAQKAELENNIARIKMTVSGKQAG